MKLFGRKSAGRAESRLASSRPDLARALTWGAQELPRSYEAQVRSAYRDNPVAQRAVRMVAEGVGAAPLACSDAAALALVTETTAGQSLLETVAAQLLLHGNGFIQIACDGGGRPVALFALRPERVKIESDARGWPRAYTYRLGDVVERLAADMIIHIKAMNPLDDIYGAGALGAASGAVAVHNAASAWNKALLDNAARPSGALVYDPGENGATLSNDQFERLRAELESSFSGAVNAGRPMLLEGGLKWQSLALSPADMDFLGLKAAAARDIALVFGVPPVLLGLPGDATYSNYREANRALWRQTILPMAGKILGAIAQGLKRSFPGLNLSVDLDQVGELAEDRERLWSALAGADFLTPEEKRAMVNLPSPLEGEGGERGPAASAAE
jgi:HK97 family phage portal protein